LQRINSLTAQQLEEQIIDILKHYPMSDSMPEGVIEILLMMKGALITKSNVTQNNY